MSDHADHTAAAAAGWQRTQLDRGAAKNPRYLTRYTKPVSGGAGTGGSSGGIQSADFESNASQAAADTGALAALNVQRRLRYGAGSVAGTNARGATLTHDVN